MPQSARFHISNLRLCFCAIVVLLCLTDQLSAQTQQASCVITTRGNTSDVLDVTFLVECGSSESNAALHFDVTSVAGPSPSDRALQIVFTVAADHEGRYPTVHRTRVFLKEGASSTQGILPFVMNVRPDQSGQRMQFWNVSVTEDQRDVEARRSIQMNPGSPYIPVRLNPGESPGYMLLQRGTQNDTALHILEIGAKLSPLPAAGILNASIQGQRLNFETPVFDLARDPLRSTSVRHVESVPDYWQYFLQFRYVVVTSGGMKQLQTIRPQASQALKDYVAAGGAVMLLEAEVDGRELVDQWLLGRQGIPSETNEKPNDNWESVLTDDVSKSLFPETRFPLFRSKSSDENPVEEAVNTDASPKISSAWARKTVARNYARGRIICLDSGDDFSNTRATSALPHAVGIATSSASDESWSLRNLIASVGKPPVWTFCGIILLFGIILGPGLLILTGWIGRRSLMILLVPLVSLGATFAIVSYEVLHEGFGTYARTTAVLSMDEESGDGFVWSRQTYFSGWPPREGLVIPNDVFCRVVSGFSMGRLRAAVSDNQYTVAYEPERSVWTGVLPARAQKQFLIGHPIKTAMPIQVKRVDDKTITLRNLTEETLPMVVCRDGKDGFYFAENVAPKSELQLTIQTFDEIAGSLSRLRSEYAPSFPSELRSMGWAFGPTQNNVEVLDQTWFGAMAEQSSQSTIKPFGFVTLMRNCDDIFVPLKANTQESLILVTGRASW